MITPNQLFMIRLKRNWKDQIRAWGSVLDWSVWLYLLIPGIIIGVGLYLEVWEQMPDWAAKVPWGVLYPIALFIMLIFARIRIFVEEADRLFLLQRPEWFQVLKRLGLLYSIAMKAVMLLLPFALLLPYLLLSAELAPAQLAMAYAYTLIVGIGMSSARQLIKGRFKESLRGLIETGIVIAAGALYLVPMLVRTEDAKPLGMAMIAAAAVMCILVAANLRSKVQFEAEVAAERESRMKTTELLMSQVIESKPFVRFKRPYVFRKSQRLFRGDDAGTLLAELRLKAFVRGTSHVRVWISFISAGSTAVAMVPLPIALVLLAAMPMLGSTWLQAQWKHWLAEEFVAQFPWSEQATKKGASRSRLWLMMPAIAIWIVVAAVKAGMTLLSG